MKKSAIRTIGRIYDPLVLISSFEIRAEISQNIWKKKLDWDEALSPEIAKNISGWVWKIILLEAKCYIKTFIHNEKYGRIYWLAVSHLCRYQQTSLRDNYLWTFLEFWRKILIEFSHYED